MDLVECFDKFNGYAVVNYNAVKQSLAECQVELESAERDFQSAFEE